MLLNGAPLSVYSQGYGGKVIEKRNLQFIICRLIRTVHDYIHVFLLLFFFCSLMLINFIRETVFCVFVYTSYLHICGWFGKPVYDIYFLPCISLKKRKEKKSMENWLEYIFFENTKSTGLSVYLDSQCNRESSYSKYGPWPAARTSPR